MKHFIQLSAIAFFFFISASCKKDSTSNNNNNSTKVNFLAILSGTNETSANASTATGSSIGVYDTYTKILTVSTTYAGITVTIAHIHKGEPGVNGPVEFPFTVTASPILFSSSALSTSDESDLMENKMYVNLHSAAFPGGEIRGQLIKQ